MADQDYDVYYRERRRLCGAPFPEFRRFFDEYGTRGAAVLDLGCGQGRDALMAARLGHVVLGVDTSAVGIAQMLEEAAGERLRVRGRVADVTAFSSRRRFDVVLLDRVLHLLATDGHRLATLRRVQALTRAGSFVLVADATRPRSLVRRFFEDRPHAWRVARCLPDFICAERVAATGRRAVARRERRPRSGARTAARQAG